MALDHVDVAWPVGPHYLEWVGPPGTCEWVAFKVKSADFHLSTLETVAAAAGGFDRWVGVEMALDAALSAMSGAFDAAVAQIFEATQWVYTLGGNDLPFKRTQEWEYTWKRLIARPIAHLMCDAEIKYDVAGLKSDVESALQTSPQIGWLEELRRLRNRSTHQTSLPRHIEVNVGGFDAGATCNLTVGSTDGTGGRPENPVLYLRATRTKLDELLRQMVGLVDYLTPNGVPSLALDQRASRITAAPAHGSAIASTPVVRVARGLPGRVAFER